MTASKNIKMEAAYRAMVDRFLGWKLPQDFGPDAGISFTPPPHLPDLYWPTGTNLFHAGQALEMFKHCVELPSAAAVRLAEKNLFDAQEAAKTIAKQAIAAEAERDALVAKLKDAEHDRDEFRRVMNGFAEKMAELEGQKPVQLDEPDYHWEAMGCGLEDRNITDRYEAMKHGWDCAMDRMFEQISEPLYARPVPAEPVNARLLTAARAVVARWETLLWKDAPATVGFIYELRDAIAACAEAAPKAVRLNVDDLSNFIRAIYGNHKMGAGQLAENIAEYLARNGIEVAE